ncbi:MAG: hypothetical protein HOO87_12845, partial [Methyloglobulus sp.]|nr:hypothetical protein [Methyloglobulus sp.]
RKTADTVADIRFDKSADQSASQFANLVAVTAQLPQVGVPAVVPPAGRGMLPRS